MMALILRAILYPGSHLFVTTGGKEQAASITIAKIEEICRLIPGLANEIKWGRGADTTKKSKNAVDYVFKNGSHIDILAARESSRGQRRTGRKIRLLSSLRAKLIKTYSLNLIYLCNVVFLVQRRKIYDRIYLPY